MVIYCTRLFHPNGNDEDDEMAIGKSKQKNNKVKTQAIVFNCDELIRFSADSTSEVAEAYLAYLKAALQMLEEQGVRIIIGSASIVLKGEPNRSLYRQLNLLFGEDRTFLTAKDAQSIYGILDKDTSDAQHHAVLQQTKMPLLNAVNKTFFYTNENIILADNIDYRAAGKDSPACINRQDAQEHGFPFVHAPYDSHSLYSSTQSISALLIKCIPDPKVRVAGLKKHLSNKKMRREFANLIDEYHYEHESALRSIQILKEKLAIYKDDFIQKLEFSIATDVNEDELNDNITAWKSAIVAGKENASFTLIATMTRKLYFVNGKGERTEVVDNDLKEKIQLYSQNEIDKNAVLATLLQSKTIKHPAMKVAKNIDNLSLQCDEKIQYSIDIRHRDHEDLLNNTRQLLKSKAMASLKLHDHLDDVIPEVEKHYRKLHKAYREFIIGVSSALNALEDEKIKSLNAYADKASLNTGILSDDENKHNKYLAVHEYKSELESIKAEAIKFFKSTDNYHLENLETLQSRFDKAKEKIEANSDIRSQCSIPKKAVNFISISVSSLLLSRSRVFHTSTEKIIKKSINAGNTSEAIDKAQEFVNLPIEPKYSEYRI